MSDIGCEICCDLMPLVKDEVASEASRAAVLAHMQTCEACRTLYGEEIGFERSEAVIVKKTKRKLTVLACGVIGLGIVFGMSLAMDQFMFYNIVIMPLIGGVGYSVFRGKVGYVLGAVAGVTYIRWLTDSFGYVLQGEWIHAFVPPLWWALIYLGLTALGVVISWLLHFGLGKEY